MYIQEAAINSLSITHVSANVKTKCLYNRGRSGRGRRETINTLCYFYTKVQHTQDPAGSVSALAKQYV